MQMRWAHIGTLLGAQKIAHWPVYGNRIAGWLNATERDMPVRIGRELAAQVHIGLHRVLVFIVAFGRRMPDIDLGTRNRLAVRVLNPGIDENRLTRCRRTNDRGAVRGRGRIRAPEWAEQIRGGLRGAIVAVVEKADEGRETQRSAHQ